MSVTNDFSRGLATWWFYAIFRIFILQDAPAGGDAYHSSSVGFTVKFDVFEVTVSSSVALVGVATF